jgi:hypothetical protein
MANFTIKSVFKAVDQLTGPVTTMRGAVDGFSKTASKSIAGIKKMAKGAAVATAAISAAAVGSLKVVSDFAGRGDDIARNASILGLTAEAYQELSYAAKMADVDQESFAAASKKLSNNLGQLRAGSGALYSTLSKLNPQLARQLRTAKDTDTAFSLVADTIAKETNVSKRAAIAQAAFGKSGQELIPMMEGLAEARKKAHDAGAIMTDEEVAAASAMDDALKKIKVSAGGALNQALASIATRLTPIIEGLTAWTSAHKDIIAQNIVGVLEGIGNAAKFIGDMWNNGLIPAFLAGAAIFKTITTGAALVQGAIAGIHAAQIAAAASGTTLSAVMLANPVGLIAAGIAALVAVVILLVKNWDHVTAAMSAAWDAIKAFGANPLGAFIDALRVVAGILDAIVAPLRFIIEAVSKIGGGAGIKIGTLADLIPKANAATGSSDIPVSPNTTGMESRSYSESRSIVDINVAAEPGSRATARQTGSAPGLNLALGRSVGGAR